MPPMLNIAPSWRSCFQGPVGSCRGREERPSRNTHKVTRCRVECLQDWAHRSQSYKHSPIAFSGSSVSVSNKPAEDNGRVSDLTRSLCATPTYGRHLPPHLSLMEGTSFTMDPLFPCLLA
ncbi:hypothetical protein KIL84_017790 [Mauremys mutica]|uniref:Uncharacterized protein n=1 Tax=Mauremys mutica TaxID=74926 RepID=A0A9D3X6R4_9SAUR|nr:hypothetical protein KIL84_017790 [Mauremys mutica]